MENILNVNVTENNEEIGVVEFNASKKKIINDENKFEVEGVIIYKAELDKVTYLTVTVLGGKKRDHRNFPNFVLYGEAREAAKQFKKGDKITATGFARSRKYKDERNNPVYSQDLVITHIEKTKSLLEEQFGFEQGGKLFDVPYSRFLVVGEVVNVNIMKNNIVKLVIHSITEGHYSNYIEYTFFARDLSENVDILKVGTRVCAVGEIQTYESNIEKRIVGKKAAENEETNKKKEKLRLQTNVILDIKKID